MGPNTSKGIIGRFFNTLGLIQMASWAFMISHYNPNSDADSEEYLQSGMTPQFAPWIGNRDVKDIDFNSLIINNVKYQNALRDFADNFRYDKTGQLQPRINGFAQRSVTHWGKLLTDLLKLGESTAGADGQNFFSAAHHNSQRNLLAAAHIPKLAVVDKTAPTPVEMSTAILHVITYMLQYVDDQDEPLNETAKKFLVMVPPTLHAPSLQATTKAVLAGAQDNPIIDSGYTVELVMNARLSAAGDQDDFYVFRTDGDTKPCLLQERGGLKLSAKAEDSEYEHDTDMWEFGAKAVRGVGLFNWENAAKATLSNAS